MPAPKAPRVAALLGTWNDPKDPDLLRHLWPHLALLSAWDGPFAAEARRLVPQAAFQAKGLWATEGVVTIPFRGAHPVALTSHFLEFRCLSTGRIHPAWNLEPGQEVQPLLSTGAGLLRYELEDRLKVTGFLERAPCLAFLGRLKGVDLVGEKLDAAAVGTLLGDLAHAFGIPCLSLVPHLGSPPRYRLLCGPSKPPEALEPALEAGLLAFHHYRLARELGQLAPSEVWHHPDPLAYLRGRHAQHGGSPGEFKVEPLGKPA